MAALALLLSQALSQPTDLRNNLKSSTMTWFIIVLNILELSACITGFLYWNKIRHTYWKWFPVYLAIIFLIEITGEYFLHVRNDLRVNIILYSYLGIPLQFFFFYWIFYRQFVKTRLAIWPLISAAIYFICLVADLPYLSKINFYFESFSYIMGCIFLLILLLIFFSRFIRSDDILHYRTSIMFWVCLGLLLFYVGCMPFFAFRKVLYNDYRDFFYIYWYVQFCFNYLMYLLFIIAFIWGKPK